MREVWKHFNLSPDNIVLSECGIQQFLPGQGYRYVVTENFVLHYIESGRGFITINNKTYYSDDFNGYILRRGQTVTYSGDKINPWKTYWIGITGTHFKEFLKKLQLNSIDTLSFKNDSEVIQIIKDICEEARSEADVSIFKYKYKTYQLLLALESEFKQEDFLVFDYEKDMTVQIYDYICKNYSNQLTIKELSQKFSISRNSLFANFKEKYQITPKQFILELQISKACQLLKETTLPIGNISDLVGFQDYFVFFKAFKKMIDLSPSDYRKSDISKEIHEKK